MTACVIMYHEKVLDYKGFYWSKIIIIANRFEITISQIQSFVFRSRIKISDHFIFVLITSAFPLLSVVRNRKLLWFLREQ
jgi:hypothetical protein